MIPVFFAHVKNYKSQKRRAVSFQIVLISSMSERAKKAKKFASCTSPLSNSESSILEGEM